jgi:CHAD domain-containing protein
VKRYRYRLELLSPLMGESFPELHAAIRRYQEVLGTMHDLDVFSAMIRQSAISESAQNDILPLITGERESRYGEFLAMHSHCSLLDLGEQAEKLL